MLENASERKSVSSNGDLAARKDERAPVVHGAYVPADTEAVDVFRLLDQLEELPEKAKHVPLMNTLVGFDSEQFYYLVLKIRANLPEDMKKAARVARDSERIVEEARDAAVQQLEHARVEANRIIEASRAEAARTLDKSREEAGHTLDQARAQAAQMVEKSEIMQMAKTQAQEIIRHAETEATEIRKGADDYARDVLGNLEAVMGKAMTTIQRGRESLEKARV